MTYPFHTLAAVSAGIAMLCGSTACAQSSNQGPLQLETKIPLGDLRGRIDHMALDLKRQRLFVAELGNDTVGVVDVAKHSVIQRLTGLKEPQGVGYEPSTDTLFVANARDGSVRLFEGDGYKPAGRIEVGGDADNVRIDASAQRVLIGHGGGALAVIDPSARNKVGDVPLKAHPESFQIDHDSGRSFVNVPDAREVAVIDQTSGKQVGSWPLDKGGNFAMAIDRDRSQILVVFRSPPELAAFSMTDGKRVAAVDTCGDVDDLFVDQKRNRVYISCGAGFVDVFDINGPTYRRMTRIPTAPGARTSFFAPELDRLFVALRATSAQPAAIWIFRPLP